MADDGFEQPCDAVLPWVRDHRCEKSLGHHGVHRCDCGEEWLNAQDWTPCPSKALSVLGMVGEPAMVRCGLQADHSGMHRFSMAWEGGIDIDRRRIGRGSSFGLMGDRMILCPTCGNKRCPHATDHRLDCTGSNDPGQAGSATEATVSGRNEAPDD